MVDMPETFAALDRGEPIQIAHLVHFDFRNGPMRLWSGDFDLATGGHVWRGLGKLGSISPIEMPMGGSAPTQTMTLSGVDPQTIAAAVGDPGDYKRRVAQIAIQHFDADSAPLDAPLTLPPLLMDTLSVKRDGDSCVVTLTLEWWSARRSVPAFAYWSDRDQKALFPGDRGLEQVAAMRNKTVTFF